MDGVSDITKSPSGVNLTPEERSHDLWKSVKSDVNDDSDKVRDLEAWCIQVGNDERVKNKDDVKKCFDEAVDKEIALRKK